MASPVTKIINGHCVDELSKLPEKIFQICITSPPYYGLRDYKTDPVIWGGNADCEHQWGNQVVDRSRATPGIAKSGLTNNGASQAASARFEKRSAFCIKCGAWRGNLGLEPTVELYVDHLVECFRAVRRVLRDDGTFWLNLGDSYSSSGGRESYDKTLVSETSGLSNHSAGISRVTPLWAKPKDLLGIPWMAAFALRADGWYLRQRIPWIKRNPMPESTEDRPSTAIEEVFLFSKSERYFYDGEAVKIPMAEYEMLRRLRERAQGLDTIFNIARDGETGIADQARAVLSAMPRLGMIWRLLACDHGAIAIGFSIPGGKTQWRK
jgi:DNA modification methylase